MKKILKLLFIFVSVFIINAGLPASEAYTKVLQGSVEKVPGVFFGAWRVESTLKITDAPSVFKKNTVDLWNISSRNNVITLSNPFTGASVQINVKDAKGNYVEFCKTSRYDNKTITDRVKIDIKGDYFAGLNELKVQTLSEADGSVIKTEQAVYYLNGERISGQDVEM